MPSWCWQRRKDSPSWTDSNSEGVILVSNNKKLEAHSMVRAGHWGNVLIKTHQHCEVEGEGVVHTRAQTSRKLMRDEENLRYPGGMRNPEVAISFMLGWKMVGEKIGFLLAPIIKGNSDAYNVGAKFGTKDYSGPSEQTVQLGKDTLMQGFQLSDTPNTPSGLDKPSPIARGLWSGRLRAAGDWDSEILADWINNGVPMGIDAEIQTAGVFPPSDPEKAIGSDDPDQQFTEGMLAQFDNYTSMKEHAEEAAKEFKRMLDEQYAVDLPRDFYIHLRHGHIHKMAILVKQRRDGVTKLRVIIDMRRSGANLRARVPERPVLPRPIDAIADGVFALNNKIKKTDKVQVINEVDYAGLYRQRRTTSWWTPALGASQACWYTPQRAHQ